MDRKEFIRKGLFGTGMFAATAALGNILKNNIDEIESLETIGFNHLPNTISAEFVSKIQKRINSQ